MDDLNDPRPQSISRQPRSIVTVNGLRAQGMLEWEVDNNLHFLADAFKITLSLSAQPAHMNWAWWALQTVFTIEVFVGFPADPDNFSGDELMSLIVGDVDEIDIDPVSDRITLIGRDLTAQFVETRTTKKWPNKKSSDIVKLLGAAHNMQVETFETSDFVGTYYKDEIVRITDTRSEWDLLTFLAQEEGAEVFVRGNTLIFREPPPTPGKPYVIQWTPPEAGINAAPRSNAIRISTARNLTLARDVIVIVRSWNQKQKVPFQVRAQASHKRTSVVSPRSIPLGSAQTYFRTFPNLTKEQALKKAQAILAEITSHERRIRVDLPGDNLLSVDNPVQVRGTATDFDDFYFAQSVVRTFSFEDGYRMTLQAKNHPAESEVAL